MRPAHPLALVTPGALSYTAFAHFPALDRLVTHVWCPVFRVSRRIVNRMYFAQACRELNELAAAPVFLICDGERVPWIEPLLNDWTGRTVLLAYDDPSNAAARFRERGAKVALITVLDVLNPCRIFAAGDSQAAALAQKLFVSVGGHVSVVAEGSRAHIEAARLLCGPVMMGLLESASQHLRYAGMPLDRIRELTQRLVAETLRTHNRSGARSWQASDANDLVALSATIAETDPALAEHLRSAAAATQKFLDPLEEPAHQTLGFIGGKSRAAQVD